MSTGAAALHGHARGPGALASIRRWIAMLVLPASILPVLFLGPTLLRAPHKLWREAGAELQRLQEKRDGHSGAPAPSRASQVGVDRSPAAGRVAASGSVSRTGRATGDGLMSRTGHPLVSGSESRTRAARSSRLPGERGATR